MLKEEFGIADDRKVILYSGNIGEKQGLEIVIAAAQKLAMKNYVFLFVGQGGGKENLKKMSSDLNLIMSFLNLYSLMIYYQHY